MKDFCTGREIDIQALLRMAQYAEEAELFCMQEWFTGRDGERKFMPHAGEECGTAGCLIGTFMMRERSSCGDPWIVVRSVGLSLMEEEFVFGCETIQTPILRTRQSEPALQLTKEQAIRRLRLFIIYKTRKAELLEDYQASRRLGDVGYASNVRRELAGVNP